jgi:hypothetical protein
MSKENKISAFAPFILRDFQFLITKKWTEIESDGEFVYKASDQYRKALDNVVMYSPEGKQPHDDAPDSLAQLSMVFDVKNRRKQARIIASPI